jgi:DNA-binding transcriptional LysR family regulator
VVAVPEEHWLATHPEVRADDLLKEPLVLLPRSLASVREPLLAALDDGADHLYGLTEASTLEATYNAVAARLAVAFVPASTATTVAVGGVVHRRYTEPGPMLELSVAWRCRPTSKVVRAFVEVARELNARPRP